jgi:hypothetical protein
VFAKCSECGAGLVGATLTAHRNAYRARAVVYASVIRLALVAAWATMVWASSEVVITDLCLGLGLLSALLCIGWLSVYIYWWFTSPHDAGTSRSALALAIVTIAVGVASWQRLPMALRVGVSLERLRDECMTSKMVGEPRTVERWIGLLYVHSIEFKSPGGVAVMQRFHPEGGIVRLHFDLADRPAPAAVRLPMLPHTWIEECIW